MSDWQICHQVIIVNWLVLSICMSVAADPLKNLQALPNGQYIFSSRLPDPNKHPDIQLAGAEIFVFEKVDNLVIGERFIANSSDTNCYQGKVLDNTLSLEVLDLPLSSDLSTPAKFHITVNLQKFQSINFADISYANGSIQRCRLQFEQYSSQCTYQM